MSELAMSEVTAVSRRTPLESKPQSAGRVLIIDDEAEIRESLETLLQLEGYTVVVANNGPSAQPSVPPVTKSMIK